MYYIFKLLSRELHEKKKKKKRERENLQTSSGVFFNKAYVRDKHKYVSQRNLFVCEKIKSHLNLQKQVERNDIAN